MFAADDASPMPASAVEGLAFPAVPDARAAALLAILWQFDRTQWWAPERLAALQRAQLHALLRHAVEQVPHYRRDPYARLAGADALEEGDWRALPILTRADVQAAGTALDAEAMPESHGGWDVVHTSGSTGRPVRAARSDLWSLFWSAFTLRDHLWHRRDFAGTLAGIRETAPDKALYPAGSRADGWGRSSAPVFRTGPYVGLNLSTPVDQAAEWLERMAPDYLLTHPSVAARLARYCRETGRALPRLRQVLTIAEAVPADLRALVQAVWGAKLVDLYSTRETGYLALQCPDHPHYHVQSEGVRVEVLDDDGRPCPPGAVGRVVVTPLHNYKTVFLRYDIGDMAEVGPPCPCGRGLPVIARILGRRQSMLRRPGGDALWSLLSSSDIDRLCACAPVRRYQVAQVAADRLVLRVETPAPLTAAQDAALLAWMRAKFPPPFACTVERRADLPAGPGGKFADVVRED